MSVFVATSLAFINHYRRYFIISGLVLILVVSAILWAYCGKSRLEKRIEDRQPVIVEAQQGANQAINTAINANADAVTAQREANAIRANKQSNVDLEEAKRNLWRAFTRLRVTRS
mgnify:CR=1 FL=1